MMMSAPNSLDRQKEGCHNDKWMYSRYVAQDIYIYTYIPVYRLINHDRWMYSRYRARDTFIYMPYLIAIIL